MNDWFARLVDGGFLQLALVVSALHLIWGILKLWGERKQMLGRETREKLHQRAHRRARQRVTPKVVPQAATFEMRVRAGEVTVVELFGTLDQIAVEQLGEALAGLENNQLVIDGEQLCYLNSDGLGQIIPLVPLLRHAGGDLKLARFHGKAATVLDVLGIDRVIEVFDRLEDAIAAFERPLPGMFDPRMELAATAAGRKVHRLDCRCLAGAALPELRFLRSVEEAHLSGLTCCRVCHPARLAC